MPSEFEIEDAAIGDHEAAFDVHVPADLKYLEGHFVGDPIVPGLAQLLLVELVAKRAWPELTAWTSLRRLKFRKAIRPGDSLRVELTQKPGQVRFVILRGSEPCSDGSLRY